MNSNIAVGIKRVMAMKGLQQKYIAKKAGFTEQQFSDMLNGRKVIRADYLLAISEALGVEIDDLFTAGQDSA